MADVVNILKYSKAARPPVLGEVIAYVSTEMNGTGLFIKLEKVHPGGIDKLTQIFAESVDKADFTTSVENTYDSVGIELAQGVKWHEVRQPICELIADSFAVNVDAIHTRTELKVVGLRSNRF